MIEKKLNIGILCYPTFGGSGVVATEIGMAMAERGHKVHFISYDIPRRLQRFTENIYFHEVEVQEYPLFTHSHYPLTLASKIVEVATYENLDLIHAHYAVPHATSAYLAKQILNGAAPKVITTLHGTDITLVGKDRSYLPITRFSIMQSDGVSVPSQFLKHETYDKLNVSTSFPIEVIPNFVDTKKYTPGPSEAPEELGAIIAGCPLSEKIITHISNFRPVKRIQDVIKIFAKVNERVPAHLILIGDGPERSGAEKLVQDLGLRKRVCFLGKQENFVGILQHSDLFFLPSELESFGLAALEAMSCGVPVIASNTQGIPEVVIDGETGFLSDVGDVEAMAQNAVRLLTDDQMHQRFSENSRARVVENYCRSILIDKYEEFYQRVLAQ